MLNPQRGSHVPDEVRQQPRGHPLHADGQRAEREGDTPGEGARHHQGRRAQQEVSLIKFRENNSYTVISVNCKTSNQACFYLCRA